MKLPQLRYALTLAIFISFTATTQTSESTEEIKTSEYLESLFHSGETFEYIVETADAYFAEKYPGLSHRELCEGEHRDGDFVKYQRWQSFWQHHLLPDGRIGDFTTKKGTVPTRGADCADSDFDVEWNNINYLSNMGLQIDQGRTNCIAFHPSDPNTQIVGASWGGLWKTTDGGSSYTLLNDNLPLAAVCGIAINPADPDHIVIALSDIVWYGPSGIGVYTSTDGGVTFAPTSTAWSLSEGVRIYYMDQNPFEPSEMIIATNTGLFKSDDFFETATEVWDGNMRSIKYSPSTENLVFAGGSSGDLYKSTDGGDSFTLVEDFGAGHVRIAVSIAPGSSTLALTHDSQLQTSTDNGETFTNHGLPESNMVIEFAPGSESILNVGNFEVHRSNDFGASFYPVTHWLGHDGLPFIHVDQRNVFVNPLQEDYVYFCNDGGIFRYDVPANEFENLSAELIITQYYDIAVSQSEDLILGGGSQDNGNIYREEDGNWNRYAHTGDGMGQDIDPVDPRYRYWSYQYGGLRRWFDGDNDNIVPAAADDGGGGAWETPYKLDPNDHNRIVVGYNAVYASNDNGDTWETVGDMVSPGADLNQLAIAPSNSEKIYATQGRRLFVKNPGVDEWEDYNTPVFAQITDLEVDPLDENVVYICYDSYIDEKKVYRSDDGGETWTNITANLPNLPFMSIELYHNIPGAIFAGTYGAVYYKDNYSDEWRKYGCVPNTSVADIEIQYHTDKVFIGTHGRGIFEAPISIYVAGTNENAPLNVIEVYPNPAENFVTVTASDADLDCANIQMMDITGRVVAVDVNKDQNGNITINCSQLQRGNYMLKVTFENGQQETKQLVLQ